MSFSPMEIPHFNLKALQSFILTTLLNPSLTALLNFSLRVHKCSVMKNSVIYFMKNNFTGEKYKIQGNCVGRQAALLNLLRKDQGHRPNL
jgi:hypothetical protein